MSLVLTYVSESQIVMVSENRVAGRPTSETFPKFQILWTNKNRPLFVGAVGLRAPIQHLFCTLPKMLREVGHELLELQDFLPGAIAHMLSKRDSATVDAAHDVVQPPVTLVVAGFDAGTNRLRAWLTLATGQGSGVVRELASDDFVAIGFLKPEDDERMMKFNRALKAEGGKMSASQIARILAEKINDISASRYLEVGRASFYAAMDHRGLIDLPKEMQPPWSVLEASERAKKSAELVGSVQ
jgi:hypothetical protein